ncbi:MAG: hypothetical protein H7Y11_03705 [Armatimonadetes bacterium]|nr:hypothetical protein [Anaerolineae bacterium]
MTNIATAENLSIEYTAQYWRLYLNGDIQPRLLLEAAPGRALRYTGSFAQKRRLPAAELQPYSIKQVVLGWSEGDQAWHLGLLLEPDLAAQRGSRWCELANWQSSDSTQYAAVAEQAARALATTLDQPFRIIAPPALGEITPQVRELPALPLKCGIWKLERDGDSLQLTRSNQWLNARISRVLWYAFWGTVYVVLAGATLTVKLALPNSGLMLPNPRILPLVGLGAGVILLLLSAKNIRDILAQPGKFTVNPALQTITAWRGGAVQWQLASHQLRSVYVSQLVNRRGKKRTLHYGEINLQTDARAFQNLMVQEQEEERPEHAKQAYPPRTEIIPLTASEVDTDLQAAAVYMAQALGGLPCWYDQRVQ